MSYDQRHMVSMVANIIYSFVSVFIATDFTLKTAMIGEQSLLPVQLISTPHCRLFYKKDNKFNVPKGWFISS